MSLALRHFWKVSLILPGDRRRLLVWKGMAQFHAYARLFLVAGSDQEKAQVFDQAVEWIEGSAGTTIEKGLKSRVFAILCTREGEDFLRWVSGHDAENGHS